MKQTEAEILPKRVQAWVYGSITAVLLFALFLAMRTLAQYPLVTTHIPTFLQEGWEPYNDPNGLFTMDVRSDWQRLTPEDDAFAEMVETVTAVVPFAPPIQPQLIFHPPQITQSFIVVSPQGDKVLYTPNVLQAQLDAAGFEIRQNQTIQTEMGHTRHRISYLNEQYACIVYLMPHSQMIIGCEERQQTAKYSVLFENWLASFQQLPSS